MREWEAAKHLQGERSFSYEKEQFIAANLWSEHAKCGYMA